MMDDYETRFGGLGRLYGQAALGRLRAAHVAVVGVGGVGSWAVEALARSGVGRLTLIDLDEVCVTNVNRQVPALDGHIGHLKIEVMAQRARQINPTIQVEPRADFFTASTADALLDAPYDAVLDAIDDLRNKALLIARCRALGLHVVTMGGAGGRQDPTQLVISDLSQTGQDGLLRKLRRSLRHDHGLPERGPWGIPCVYSREPVMYPTQSGQVCATPEPGTTLRLDCASGFGTASFVTGAFGFAAAGLIVRRLATQEAP